MTARSVLRRVAIPSLDREQLYDVDIEDGVFTRIEPVDRRADQPGPITELWPGYVEAHAHLALPANFDDSLDDPRISALSYLYHGVTHVADLFGFPLLKSRWEAGAAASAHPYPELVHCGYAATATRDAMGLTGHGVEFPSPVFMLGMEEDLADVLHANRARGGTFLKVMFTDGTEQPEMEARFSRLSPKVLEHTERVTREQGVPAVLDCNTREEVLEAYRIGFRLFAHPVRDFVLSDEDWDLLADARFVTTLSGLRPMVMERAEFEAEYGRPGFLATQDGANLEFVQAIEEPYGIQYKCQDTRTAALRVMRENNLAALRRGRMLVGTDCGNTGAFHGYSLLGELDLLAGESADPELRHGIRHAATVDNWHFFHRLAQREAGAHPIAVGAPATYNLFAAARGADDTPLSTLPDATVVAGTPVDRAAIAREIRTLRDSASTGKVVL
ncbi:hydrolase [Kitasatospora sp. NPDC048365]|uniref:hydrolase n=1 Tax=Kitasatospora sp. NPDC048365 TaxID=3364050 RepID=UPI003719EEC8